MAVDATGTPTTLGIPRFDVANDAPSGLGFNAAMQEIDTLIQGRIAEPPSPVDGDILTRVSGAWVAQAPSAPASSVPAGSVMPYAGASAPTGWLMADGSEVSRSTYSNLFSAISTAYGTGDGSTTFNIPDLRGRVPVGVGTHADVAALGGNDGSALASRRPKHNHTVNQTPHQHTSPTSDGSGGSSGASDASSGDGITGAANANITIGPQTSAPTDGPAYVVLNYIIKT